MKIIFYIISILITLDCLGQAREIETDTIHIYNGYFEVEQKESNKIVESLFDQNGQLIRIKYAKLRGNPKSEWGSYRYYYKVNRFSKNGNKLNSFQDTTFNNNNKKISGFGTYKNGKQKHIIDEYYDNKVKKHQEDTLNLRDTTIKWYVFKNDSIYLESIKLSYPFNKVIIHKKWNYKGCLENIEYYDRSIYRNPIKEIKIDENGLIYYYYQEKFKRNHGFKNSIIVQKNNDGSLEYCKRDRNRNCIEERVIKNLP